MKVVIHFGRALALFVALLVGIPTATAQTYPNRLIKIVVAAGPGGGLDTLVRFLKTPLEQQLGQPVIIDNRPGASGIIAVQAVTRAPADGYTVLFVSGTLIVTNPFILKDLPYKPLEELDAVAGYGSLPMVWVANPSLGFKTLADLSAYAQKNPGKLLVAHGGAGTLPDLIQQAFLRKNKLEAQIVPYKTSPQGDVDTVAGHVHVTVDNMSSVSPFVKQGQLTALAVTTKTRSKLLPDVPSWLETEQGPFDVSGWYGFVVPKGTPPEIITALNKAINAAIQTPEVKTRLDELGMQFAPQTPGEFRDFMHSEYKKFGDLIKQIGLEPQ